MPSLPSAGAIVGTSRSDTLSPTCLSPREREVLARLPTVTDTRRLARELGICAYTVQDHLRSIFAKTGALTRQELVARATGC
jgi:DNA-binding CsgD family transcriptional regulator